MVQNLIVMKKAKKAERERNLCNMLIYLKFKIGFRMRFRRKYGEDYGERQRRYVRRSVGFLANCTHSLLMLRIRPRLARFVNHHAGFLTFQSKVLDFSD